MSGSSVRHISHEDRQARILSVGPSKQSGPRLAAGLELRPRGLCIGTGILVAHTEDTCKFGFCFVGSFFLLLFHPTRHSPSIAVKLHCAFWSSSDDLKHRVALAELFCFPYLFVWLSGSCNWKMGSPWKSTAVLTWLLAAESVYSLPQSQPIGSVAEKILEQTATESSAAFKTQYPPSNAEERLLIPETSPVCFVVRC